MEKPQPDQPTYVRVEGSDIFFYSEVSQDSILELCTTLKRMERLVDRPTIRIHIHSEGGDLCAGLGCMDYIRSLKAHVITIVEGVCASAATFVFLGGAERIVTRNSYVLIHQLSHDIWGQYEQLKDEMKQCEQLMSHIKRVYLRETDIPERKLDRLLKRDLYLSHKKCVKYNVHRSNVV